MFSSGHTRNEHLGVLFTKQVITSYKGYQNSLSKTTSNISSWAEYCYSIKQNVHLNNKKNFHHWKVQITQVISYLQPFGNICSHTALEITVTCCFEKEVRDYYSTKQTKIGLENKNKIRNLKRKCYAFGTLNCIYFPLLQFILSLLAINKRHLT